MYNLLRNILFLFDAEKVHYFSMNAYSFLIRIGLRKYLTQKFKPKSTPVKALGLTFRNLAGLGAGFDKNARYLEALETMGFGFIEIGTVTPLPQSGNAKPRLFRLPDHKALVNSMGFNNDGVVAIASRLKAWKEKYKIQ